MAAHLDHLGRRRIVVTGVGAVTPLGVGARRLFDGWTAGESGLENGVGECRDFDPGDYFSRREARRADRFTQLAVAAADEAVPNVLSLRLYSAPAISAPSSICS